jgi:adenylate cyclase
MGEMRASNVTSLLISAAGLAVAVLVSLLLANRVARPLVRLAAQMAEVGRFELAERPFEPTIFREIARMEDALVGMKRGLRSFASYVPRDVVRAVLASGQEATLGGKTQELTVFFSDIAGFTTVAEATKPDELVAMLGEYLDEMTRILVAHGGTVDKFLGDGIMAFWGAPLDDPSHAARACEAAIACRARLLELRARGERPWAVQWRTRIGLATGEVLVGNIGTPERMNYTVMGDTANLAARLEGLNKLYGTSILVSESTRRLAEGRIVARPVDVTAVKGKTLGVKVYELLGVASSAAPDAVAVAAASARALDAYLTRDFATAIAAWEEVLAKLPGDDAARTMIARARGYAASPPPADWAGVHVAEEK